MRLLGLVEYDSRGLLGAGFGGTGGVEVIFLGYDLFRRDRADLLCRAKADRKLPVEEELTDGSYLSHLLEPDTKGKVNGSPCG